MGVSYCTTAGVAKWIEYPPLDGGIQVQFPDLALFVMAKNLVLRKSVKSGPTKCLNLFARPKAEGLLVDEGCL